MGKKQELDFENKWIEERKNGFDVIYLLISIMVAGAFPFFAWGINELRMKNHDKRNDGESNDKR